MSEINKLHLVLFYRNTADCIDSDHIFKINPIDKHIVANCKSKFNHNFRVNKLDYNPVTELSKLSKLYTSLKLFMWGPCKIKLFNRAGSRGF